jgi:hypothetical protein
LSSFVVANDRTIKVVGAFPAAAVLLPTVAVGFIMVDNTEDDQHDDDDDDDDSQDCRRVDRAARCNKDEDIMASSFFFVAAGVRVVCAVIGL